MRKISHFSLTTNGVPIGAVNDSSIKAFWWAGVAGLHVVIVSDIHRRQMFEQGVVWCQAVHTAILSRTIKGNRVKTRLDKARNIFLSLSQRCAIRTELPLNAQKEIFLMIAIWNYLIKCFVRINPLS